MVERLVAIAKHKLGDVATTSIKVLFILVAGAMLQFLFHVLLARYLNVQSYGVFAFGFSFYTLTLLAVKFAGDTIILRELPLEDAWRGPVPIHVLISSALMFAIVLLAYFVIDSVEGFRGPKGGTIAAFLVLLPIGAFVRFSMAVARVKGLVVSSQFGDQVARPAACILALFVFYQIGFDGVPAAVAAVAIGLLVALGVTLLPTVRYWQRLVRESSYEIVWKDYLVHAKSAATITAISGQSVAIKQVDVLVLGILAVPSVVGGYAAATKLALLATFMLAAVNMVVAPVMAKSYAQGKLDELQTVLTTSARLVTGAGLLIWAVAFFFADELLSLFGEDFQDAATALKILISAQLLNAFCGPVGTLLNMIGKEAVAIKFLSVSFVLCVGLNLLLVPLYKEIGAATAFAVSVVTWNLTMAIYVRREFGLNSTVWG